MADEPRITDHDEILRAARTDASREGARMVKMSIIGIWQMIHRAPSLSDTERERLAATLSER